MEPTGPPPPVWTYSCNKTVRLPKSSIKPLRALIISNTFQGGGGLIWERGLFNLKKTMVSVLHKELGCKVEKFKYNTLEVMQPRIENNSELPASE